MAISEYSHSPVLFDEVMSLMNLRPGMAFVDATLGLGGHARGVLERIVPGGELIGIDADSEAISIASQSLQLEGARIHLFNKRFSALDECLKEAGVEKADGFLFDLGVSSMQLDNFERGFSFRADALLDMRMCKTDFLTASDIVNSFSEDELVGIFERFGEDPNAKRIAKAIVLKRKITPIETTGQLVAVIESVVGQRRGKIHPATRVFQALRIVVNRELDELKEAIDKAFDLVAPGGRIGVISFHSLEDRVVKQAFRKAVRMGMWRPITKKPVRPGERETSLNPRARSAKFRVVERLEVSG